MENKVSVRLIANIRMLAIMLCLGYGVFALLCINPVDLEQVIWLIFSTLAIIPSIGLFFLKKIFRNAIIVFSLIYLVYYAIGIAAYPFSSDNTGQGLVGLVFMSPLAFFNLVALIFLTRHKAKEQFK